MEIELTISHVLVLASNPKAGDYVSTPLQRVAYLDGVRWCLHHEFAFVPLIVTGDDSNLLYHIVKHFRCKLKQNQNYKYKLSQNFMVYINTVIKMFGIYT